ncbi:hypothetical protein [Lysobacter changpingensis]|uniref:hypothetical protein n=1 Tax=Lysobacter changpingensis TaxID=2792784 RepID=UPI001A901785|nr:hypothetical protein [Lysobacter changpingensis]
MANSFIYELTMALVPGALAGYYFGLLMAKQAKFNALKHEALRCVRVIDYMGDERRTDFQHTERVKELHLIASELFHLKHRGAGEKLLIIVRQVTDLIASSREVPVETTASNFARWQKELRALRPGWRFILPWGQI